MAHRIIDRRRSNKNRLAGSRKQLIKKIRGVIDEQIHKHIGGGKLGDIGDNVSVPVPKKKLKEDRLGYIGNRSDQTRIFPGNDKYDAGDIERLSDSATSSGGSGEGDGEGEEFNFVLTRDEFLEILFEQLELPNFCKKSAEKIERIRFTTGGYVKEGNPSRIALKKTMEMAAARRIATRNTTDRKPRFLDDVDIRYRNLIEVTEPSSHAVMICIMDVSGSMGADERYLGKLLFTLVYMFLKSNYKYVDVHFISHTTEAEEVDEHTFFNNAKTGGTIVSPAIKLARNIIEQRYNIESTNIYVTQVSDGDNYYYDEAEAMQAISDILPLVQFYAYAQVGEHTTEDYGLSALYEETYGGDGKMGITLMNDKRDVVKAMKELFGKRGGKNAKR